MSEALLFRWTSVKLIVWQYQTYFISTTLLSSKFIFQHHWYRISCQNYYVWQSGIWPMMDNTSANSDTYAAQESANTVGGNKSITFYFVTFSPNVFRVFLFERTFTRTSFWLSTHVFNLQPIYIVLIYVENHSHSYTHSPALCCTRQLFCNKNHDLECCWTRLWLSVRHTTSHRGEFSRYKILTAGPEHI